MSVLLLRGSYSHGPSLHHVDLGLGSGHILRLGGGRV